MKRSRTSKDNDFKRYRKNIKLIKSFFAALNFKLSPWLLVSCLWKRFVERTDKEGKRGKGKRFEIKLIKSESNYEIRKH
jgi:hypothetical protein